MRNFLFTLIFLLIYLVIFITDSQAAKLNETLCSQEGYECLEVQPGDSWSSLWPNPEDIEKLKRINRIGNRLRKGMKIAVPKDLSSVSKLDLSPLDKKVEATGNKQVIADLHRLAWGAYSEEGELINWGPLSAGKSWCPDIQMKCRTPTGQFKVQRKGGASCKSNKFPIPDGGAPIPYCMFFHGGYALHGSYDIPGYHASHGCVRMLVEDAKWLNQKFIEVGTSVTILPY